MHISSHETLARERESEIEKVVSMPREQTEEK